MTKSISLVLAVFLVVASSACAQEIAYAYGESGGRPLESRNITEYNGMEIVTSTIAGAGPSLGGSGMTVDEMKREIGLKLNVGNQTVRDEGLRLIRKYPGDGTINQICSIYEHMVGNWSYARDTRGEEVLQYSNQSLDYGEGENSGQGDCDDFSILLASLIESIGGTSRIILAYGPDSGHAYTEVYLGKAGGPESDVGRMLAWLRKSYQVEEINTHTDLKTGDIWLNLDWWMDPNTRRELARHPGGPFFKAISQVPVPLRENITLQPLMPVNEPPDVLFTISPEVPVAGQNTVFDASQSKGIGGRIESYLWDFGDGSSGAGKTVNHSYTKTGSMHVNLTVTDDRGLNDANSKIVHVNNPPTARLTYKPAHPMANEVIEFDAGTSYDPDGKISSYSWEFGDNGTGLVAAASLTHSYSEIGAFNVTLTVTDDIGTQNSTTVPIDVSGAKITNVQRLGPVSQSFDLMGEYSLPDASKSIWIFVKPQGGRYFPQTRNSCHPSSAHLENGKWESRITVGGPGDSEKYFELIAAVADEKADREIRRVLHEWWCPDKHTAAGFDELPNGVKETDRIMVKRSDGEWSNSQDISDISLPGTLNISKLKNGTFQVYPDSKNASVDVRMTVHGNRSNDVLDEIWVLVHSLKEGRWYPQSSDNENNSGHVTNMLPKGQWTPDWYIDAFFTGDAGDPYELVVVLANCSADKFFNEFQKSCAMAKKPDGSIGNYTGLLTISLPAGIDEKDRMRAYRK